MKLDMDWLDDLFSKTHHDAWTELFLKVEQIVPTTLSDIKNHYQEIERSFGALDRLLHHGAWELWENFHAAPKGSEAVKQFWQMAVGPKAVLILDSLSVREVAPLLEQASKVGAELESLHFAGSELPSETEVYALALGLPGRFALRNRPLPTNFPCQDADSYVDTFKKIPFGESEQKIPNSKHIFLWHGWPDDTLHELAKADDAFNQLINNVRDTFDSDGFRALLRKLCQGRQVLITSDHGYCNTSAFAAAQNVQHQELKLLGHARAKPIRPEERQPGSTIPPVTMELKSSSSEDLYRVAVGRLRPSDKGFPALTHGGLSLAECTVPLIHLRAMNHA